MLKKLYKFFIPEEHYKYLIFSERSMYLANAHNTVAIISLIIILVIAAIIPNLIFGADHSHNLPLVFGISLLVGSLWMLKKTGNYHYSAWLVVFLTVTILPIRTWQTGGQYAPNLSTYLAAIIIIYSLLGKNFAMFVTFICGSFIIYVHTLVVPIPFGHETTSIIVQVSAWIPVIVVIFNLKNWNKLSYNIEKHNHKDLSNITYATSIAREINNPLTVIYMSIDRLQKRSKNLDQEQLLQLRQYVEILIREVKGFTSIEDQVQHVEKD